jgi:hypothetical protein
MKKKIAFINAQNHPQCDSTFKVLQANFPDHQIDTIKILDLIKSSKKILFLNSLHTILEYGGDILLGRKKFKKIFLRTVYLIGQVKKLVNEKLKNGNYYFSFQMGSVFDTSLEGLPHFIYTDHSHLANLDYPLFNKNELLSNKNIEVEKRIYSNATLTFTYSSNITNSIIKQYLCPEEKVVCVYAGSNVNIDNSSDGTDKYSS